MQKRFYTNLLNYQIKELFYRALQATSYFKRNKSDSIASNWLNSKRFLIL